MSRNLIPEYVIHKVGGRFRLSALLQKRMQQLNRGAPRLVDIDTDDPMKIALAELMADKISFVEDASAETVVVGEPRAEADEELGAADDADEGDLDLTIDDGDDE